MLNLSNTLRVGNFRHIVLLSLCTASASFLTACDQPLWCGPCPKAGEIRNFLCDCFDPKKEADKNHHGTPGERTDFPACICLNRDDTVRAWFTYKPEDYGTFDPIVVSSASCEDQSLCEHFPTPTGGFEIKTRTGRYRIQPNRWETSAGSGIYSLFGTSTKLALYEPITRFSGRLALRAISVRRQLVPVNTDNSIESCKALCEAGDPYCLNAQIAGGNSTGLQRLHQLLNTNPSEITRDQLLSAFQLGQDPCDRTSLEISGGMLSNSGKACTIATDVPVIGGAQVDFPSTLQGKFSISPDQTLKLEIDDANYRPVLRFTDAAFSSEWGGAIKAIAGTNSHVIASVGSQSCLRLDLQ